MNVELKELLGPINFIKNIKSLQLSNVQLNDGQQSH